MSLMLQNLMYRVITSSTPISFLFTQPILHIRSHSGVIVVIPGLSSYKNPIGTLGNSQGRSLWRDDRLVRSERILTGSRESLAGGSSLSWLQLYQPIIGILDRLNRLSGSHLIRHFIKLASHNIQSEYV